MVASWIPILRETISTLEMNGLTIVIGILSPKDIENAPIEGTWKYNGFTGKNEFENSFESDLDRY